MATPKPGPLPGPAQNPADLTPHDFEREHMTQPAHSPARAPNDMLPPSAATPEAPGVPGMAGEVTSDPVTHRRTPEAQNPEPSERWFPPVSD